MARTIQITRTERERRLEQSHGQQFYSAFNLLNEHNGWRNGKLHLFIGPTGAGKSTLTRTLLMDSLMGKGKDSSHFVGNWLSEESEDEFITEINEIKIPDSLACRLFIQSEQDNSYETIEAWMMALKNFVDENKLSILFIDNITTSQFYMDAKPDVQGRITRALKRLAQVCNIPVVIFAHTSAEVTETHPKLINVENIRGSKNLPNMVEFSYIIQPFYYEGERHNFIRIAKHRGQHIKERLFKFYYYERVKIFGKDEHKSFESFKQLFNKREKL